MNLIALTGKARSGKDLAAQLISYKKKRVIRIALADPLKKAVQCAFGLSYEQAHSPALKEEVIEYWGLSPRQMFQQFGDAMKDKFGEDIFVKRWEIDYNKVKLSDHVVVPDCRCDVEADRFRELGGVIVEIQRGTGLIGSTGSHRTELGLSTLPDFVIDNQGDMDQLECEVRRLLEYIE
jgi:hypothetical protein